MVWRVLDQQERSTTAHTTSTLARVQEVVKKLSRSCQYEDRGKLEQNLTSARPVNQLSLFHVLSP